MRPMNRITEKVQPRFLEKVWLALADDSDWVVERGDQEADSHLYYEV